MDAEAKEVAKLKLIEDAYRVLSDLEWEVECKCGDFALKGGCAWRDCTCGLWEDIDKASAHLWSLICSP